MLIDFKIKIKEHKDSSFRILVCEFWASFKEFFPNILNRIEVYQKWAKLESSLKKTAQQEAKIAPDKPGSDLSGDILNCFKKKYFLDHKEVLQIIEFSKFWRTKFKKNQIMGKNNPVFKNLFIKFTHIFNIYIII